MNLPVKILLWLVFAGVAACAFYLWAVREEPALAARLAETSRAMQEFVAPGTGKKAATTEAPSTDLGEGATPALPDPALPLLDDSDAAVGNVVISLLGTTFARDWLTPQDLIRRLVVTIDNLPNARLPLRQRVVRAVPGKFEVTGPDNAMVGSAANAARYAPLVEAVLAVDAAQWVKRYRSWYPLLQQAYAEIADPRQLFNDRLIAVIDHLVGVQVPTAPPQLVHPGVLYRYADPALEAQSAGAHVLYRLGHAQSLRVQARLREVRALLDGPEVATPPP